MESLWNESESLHDLHTCCTYYWGRSLPWMNNNNDNNKLLAVHLYWLAWIIWIIIIICTHGCTCTGALWLAWIRNGIAECANQLLPTSEIKTQMMILATAKEKSRICCWTYDNNRGKWMSQLLLSLLIFLDHFHFQFQLSNLTFSFQPSFSLLSFTFNFPFPPTLSTFI